jgi:hypothetical protein
MFAADAMCELSAMADIMSIIVSYIGRYAGMSDVTLLLDCVHPGEAKAAEGLPGVNGKPARFNITLVAQTEAGPWPNANTSPEGWRSPRR